MESAVIRHLRKWKLDTLENRFLEHKVDVNTFLKLGDNDELATLLTNDNWDVSRKLQNNCARLNKEVEAGAAHLKRFGCKIGPICIVENYALDTGEFLNLHRNPTLAQMLNCTLESLEAYLETLTSEMRKVEMYLKELQVIDKVLENFRSHMVDLKTFWGLLDNDELLFALHDKRLRSVVRFRERFKNFLEKRDKDSDQHVLGSTLGKRKHSECPTVQPRHSAKERCSVDTC